MKKFDASVIGYWAANVAVIVGTIFIVSYITTPSSCNTKAADGSCLVK